MTHGTSKMLVLRIRERRANLSQPFSSSLGKKKRTPTLQRFQGQGRGYQGQGQGRSYLGGRSFRAYN